MKWFDTLAQKRTQAKMSQAELGLALGLTGQAVSSMEKGHRKLDTDLAERLGQIFQCDPIEFTEWTMKPKYFVQDAQGTHEFESPRKARDHARAQYLETGRHHVVTDGWEAVWCTDSKAVL